MRRSVVLVLLLVLAGLTVWRVTEVIRRRAAVAEGAGVPTEVPVEVISATPRALTEQAQVVGTLRALHEADVVVSQPGRVMQILADVGTVVKRGTPLAVLEQRDLSLQVQQVEGGLLAAEAARDTATRDLSGAQALVEVGGVTEVQLVAAKSRAAAAEAQVVQARAALDMARARLGDATLRSPIAGVVIRRGTDVGRFVGPGVPAFTVADLSGLELVIAVDERVVTRIQPGASVGITSDSVTLDLPDGTVKLVSPALDPQTHKAEVVVALPYRRDLLPHGSATATLTLGRSASAVAVPSQAVLEDKGESVVFVAEGKVARRKVVKAGIRDGAWVEVSGIPEGASVVITGNTYLSDGAAIRVRATEPS